MSSKLDAVQNQNENKFSKKWDRAKPLYPS